MGGNRAKWSVQHEITSVEHDPELARLYHKRFPNDEIIVGDAHQYLLDHMREFDFIWSSPPCPSHSRLVMPRAGSKLQYPDMKLYQEIILLQNFFKGKFCVENVIPYYEPLIPAKKRGKHLFWTNFALPFNLNERKNLRGIVGANPPNETKLLCDLHGFDLDDYHGKQ